MCHQPWFIFIALFSILSEGYVILAKNEVNLEDHLQPLDVGINPEYDKLVDDGKLCSRNCTKYPESRICYYKLVAEQYHAMGPACKNCSTDRDHCFGPHCITADGIERTVLVFNRMLPGPAFHICFGDRVIVDLENSMPARETSIHWHGLLQKTSPWEDGVPFVTQCPISSNSKFRYDFLADTSGTHFYHSHSASQLFDGLSGPFVVRTSAETDPVSELYDYDLFSHTILIRDWFHQISDVRFPGYNKNETLTGHDPESYLINGKGKCLDAATKKQTNTPLAEFYVLPNKKFRFRIVTDTSTTCSLQFTIENHPMLLISADGYPVEPQLVRTLYLSSADIYDVVIDANQPPRSYWIRAQGYGPGCSSAYQNAILRYEGSNILRPPTSSSPKLFDAMKKFPELNNLRKPCRLNDDNYCLDEIQSLQKAPERLLKENPDQRILVSATAYYFENEVELYGQNTYLRHYLPKAGPGVKSLGGMYQDQINSISNIFPSFPLLSDPTNPLINKMKCPKECPTEHCDCLHLIKLGYNNVIEMVFVDKIKDIMDHPFHIHGHHWIILKLGNDTKEVLKSDRFAFKINSTNDHPLFRDSVPVPAGGFAVVRFIADNPGFWLLHCHFTAHNEFGMQLVLQVGEPEQFPQLPKNWPQCGDYLPVIE